MSDRLLRRYWLPLAIAILASLPVSAAEITGAAWNGNDFVVALSDSASYSVDLAESDSAQIVIRIADATRGPGVPGAAIGGPGERRAALTPVDGGIRLTITRPGRIGYSTLWRPYSHRLVIHTFDWDSLSYQEAEYHKGLLALEEGLPDRAAELLGVAHATGDRRAGSVLGVYYARTGRDSLATHYLSSPVDGDDYAALTEVYRRAGDSSAARASEANARRLLAVDLTSQGALPAPDTVIIEGETLNAGTMLNSKKPGDWRYIALGTLAIVILLGLIIWAVGRSVTRRSAAAPTTPARADERAPAPPVAGAPRVEAPVHVVRPSAAVPAAAPATAATPAPAAAVTASAPAVATAPAESVRPSVPEDRSATAPVAPAPDVSSPVNTQAPFAPPAAQQASATPVVEASRPAPEPVMQADPPHELERTDVRREPAEDPPHEMERQIPTQAAEVRQKIQSQRKDMPAPSESTVAAARRLNVSRDNVELRKRMADAVTRRDQEER